MRKQLFPAWMLWPSLYFIIFFILFFVIPDHFNMVAFLNIYVILCVVFGVCWLVSVNMTVSADIALLARLNTSYKLCYLPTYLVAILGSIITFIVIKSTSEEMHGGFFFLYCLMLFGAVAVGGLVNMIVCAIVTVKIGTSVKDLDSYYSVNTAAHFFGHLIPIVDIFSSVTLYRQIQQFRDLSKKT